MPPAQNPISRSENIVIQELKDELLIYDLNTEKAYCLNETSATVFQLCNGRNSIADISRQASKLIKKEIGEDFVWLALDGLRKDNLLQNSADFKNVFEGLERRKIIKKVGMTTMIALPLVSSIIAPTAINAQSVCASGITCGSNCCPPNSVCTAAGTCCTNGTTCGVNGCCASGTYCSGSFGTCCPNGVISCPGGFIGLVVCCPSGACAPGGGCQNCPSSQICTGAFGTICCSPGQTCFTNLGCCTVGVNCPF